MLVRMSWCSSWELRLGFYVGTRGVSLMQIATTADKRAPHHHVHHFSIILALSGAFTTEKFRKCLIVRKELFLILVQLAFGANASWWNSFRSDVDKQREILCCLPLPWWWLIFRQNLWLLTRYRCRIGWVFFVVMQGGNRASEIASLVKWVG